MSWPFINLCPCPETPECEKAVYCGPPLVAINVMTNDTMVVALQKVNEAIRTLNAQNINTAFGVEIYSSVISRIHDPNNPNFEIHLTGDLSLTITGVVNGDAGIINLYFNGTQTVTLNGLNTRITVGTSQMISVFFIVDIQGLYWFEQYT